jgi:AraC-like DNA-binding protein
MRLNEAVRLSWSRPELSIRAIADKVGFDDLSYFHRVFMQEFGMTPAQIGRRAHARWGDLP